MRRGPRRPARPGRRRCGRRAARPSAGGCTAATTGSTPTSTTSSRRRPPSAASRSRVPVTDTADAVQRVVAQRRAGKTRGGAVDLIWINGENFADGQAGRPVAARTGRRGCPTPASSTRATRRSPRLPGARRRPGVAVEPRRVRLRPTTARVRRAAARRSTALLAYARRHPGRFTYPAPPDFTGSAFVRQVVQAKGEDAGFAYLRAAQAAPVPPRARCSEVRGRAQRAVRQRQGRLRDVLRRGVRALGGAQGPVPRHRRARSCSAADRCTNVVLRDDPRRRRATAPARRCVADLLLGPAAAGAQGRPGRRSATRPCSTSTGSRGPAAPALGRAATRRTCSTDLGGTVPELPARSVAPLERRWKREILR